MIILLAIILFLWILSFLLSVFWFWVCATYISLHWTVKPCLPKHVFCILIWLAMLRVIYSISYQYVVILSDVWWIYSNGYLWPASISFKLLVYQKPFSPLHMLIIFVQVHSLLWPASCSKDFSFTSIVLAFKSSRLLVA